MCYRLCGVVPIEDVAVDQCYIHDPETDLPPRHDTKGVVYCILVCAVDSIHAVIVPVHHNRFYLR